jgi:hypothetical protein
VFCKCDRQHAGVLRDDIKRILELLDESLELHEEAEALKHQAVMLAVGFLPVAGVAGWLMRPVGAAVRGGGIAARGAARGGAGFVRVGQAGEAAVRRVADIGEKALIRVGGRNRIPDGLTSTVLSEVKNVNSLSYTQQLRDFATYASQRGLRFDLWVRPTTQLSGPLLDAIEAGAITRRLIP